MRYRSFLYIALVLLSTRSSAEPAPTFTRDILPILQGHCQMCHRPEQVGPMSLLTYQETRPWAKAIRNVVSQRTMPPFHVDAPFGEYQNDFRLTDEQIETFTDWIDRGAPQGDPADAPTPIAWPTGEWARPDPPDLVLEFPEYTSHPTNTDEEILLFSDKVFGPQTWVEAFEVKSSDYRAVHHVGVVSTGKDIFVPEDLVLNTDDEHLDKFDGASNGGIALFTQRNLFTWLPGQRIETRPEGSAFLIRKGDRIVLQVHIAPTGEAVPVKLSLGLWLFNGDLTATNGGIASFMWDLSVPPRDPKYVSRETMTCKRDSWVTGYSIHMHLRGASSQIFFHYPDGKTELAFDMPHYNFDWQRRYWLTHPKQIPAGTQIEFVGVWDNSADNPLNPDPNAEAPWGGKTTDEMYTGVVYLSNERARPVRVSQGLVVTNDETP